MSSIHKLKSTQIEVAMTEDVRDIFIIHKECSLSEWSVEDYYREVIGENSLLLVAKIKREVVGFLSARLTVGEIDLVNIGVLPHFQKEGIGRALFSDLLERIKSESVKSIWLEVRKSNINAISFYCNKGFRQIQIRKNFYARPVEDALVMKYDIC